MKNYIATIQEILTGRNEDFDRAATENKVKLVRQKDTRTKISIHGMDFEESLYELYLNDRQNFLNYQGEQRNPVFSDIDYIVVFLGEYSTLSRFIGVFKVNGLTGEQYQEEPRYCYNIVPAEGFEILNEKIIIDWGKAAVSWHQYYNNIKYVIRIEGVLQNEAEIPSFTSYSNVNVSYSQLKYIVDNNLSDWKNGLKAVNCIYIITDKKNGRHYIGSTYNLAGGMWERWTGYAKTRHNKNTKLKEAIEADPDYENNFYWSILETLPLNVAPHEAMSRENLYKEKFMTREFGYNGN